MVRQVMLAGLCTLGLAGAQTSPSAPGNAPGGASQRVSTEGCLNEWLFNGVWRLRVLSVTRGEQYGQSVWQTRIELRNGVNRNLQPSFQGGINASDTQLIAASGNVLDMGALNSVDFDQKVSYKNLPPGGGVTYTARFKADAEDLAAPPTKLLMNVKIGPLAKNLPWGKNPSFRVNLACKR